jgi:hypothetical protein
MQVKIFSMNDPMKKKSQNQQNFEDKINQWLSQKKGVEVVRIEQSASGGSFNPHLWMISIWYNEIERQ